MAGSGEKDTSVPACVGEGNAVAPACEGGGDAGVAGSEEASSASPAWRDDCDKEESDSELGSKEDGHMPCTKDG